MQFEGRGLVALLMLALAAGCVGNSVGVGGDTDDGEDAGVPTTGGPSPGTSWGADDSSDVSATVGSISVSDGAFDDDGPGSVSATTAWDTGGGHVDGDDDDDGWDDDGWGDTEWGGSDYGTADAGDDWGSTGVAPCSPIDIGSAMGSEVYAGLLDDPADVYSLACNAAVSSDVALVWTPPDVGDYTIRLTSPEFDPVLGLSAFECGGPTMGCNDDCNGTGAGMVLSGWLGPVVIVVETADAAVGAFSLSIEAGASLQCD